MRSSAVVNCNNAACTDPSCERTRGASDDVAASRAAARTTRRRCFGLLGRLPVCVLLTLLLLRVTRVELFDLLTSEATGACSCIDMLLNDSQMLALTSSSCLFCFNPSMTSSWEEKFPLSNSSSLSASKTKTKNNGLNHVRPYVFCLYLVDKTLSFMQSTCMLK